MTEPTVDPRASTPVFGWHVPVLGDVPNVPADLNALATGIETTLAGTPASAAVYGTYPTAPPASTNVKIDLATPLAVRGTNVTHSGTTIRIAKAGAYQVTAWIAYLYTGDIIKYSGSHVYQFAAGDTLTVGGWWVNTGPIFRSKVTYWKNGAYTDTIAEWWAPGAGLTAILSLQGMLTVTAASNT